MGILQRVIGRFGRKNELHSSRSIEFFTKYGLCRAKMYLYKKQHYLLLQSRVYSKEESMFGYIYFNNHALHKESGLACGCNDQVDIALKMIMHQQGFILYITPDAEDIERCLYKIEASKRDFSVTSDRFVTKEIIESYSEYAALMHIVKELGIAKLHLVSSNPGVALQIQRLGLELEAWSSVISFDYGDASLSRL